MTASRPDYANEHLIRRNRLPPRAYYLPDRHLNLGGRWQFSYASYAEAAIPDFQDPAAWSSIQVPGHWQLQGFGKPHYTNVQYPFPVDPPHVPSENPTGIYYTKFTVPGSWGKFQKPEYLGSKLEYRLRFEGVDSAFHLFVNGKEIGYSQGSRNAAEFDISDAIRTSEGLSNILVVKVYQWCDGSYIEDQDQWWLSGIYRNVYLLAFPKAAYIKDFTVTTRFDSKYQNAELDLKIDTHVNSNARIHVELTSQDGSTVFDFIMPIDASSCDISIMKHIENPLHWTAESPNLYSLRLVIMSDGDQQSVEQSVGFRQVDIKDGVLLVNGKPILLKGVNRHDHHPRFGRAVPYEFMRQDLLTMKRHNINALRCSHYPNGPELYEIANEIGLYVMDEADLECHGFYDAIARPLDIPEHMNYEERKKICFEKAAQFTSNNPSWEAAYVERMRQLVHRDKNQPCVIMWSLGNEAFYGRNHKSMYDWAKKTDPTRPVHYEGDAEAKSADVFSYMYPSVKKLIEHAQKNQKPTVLCEYGHAMGTGPGALKEYQDAFYEYPRLCGGFIWEWANHGIQHTDETGKTFYAYGGDFGDYPNDGNFVMDGLCDSEHRPGPGLVDFKTVIQPVRVSRDEKMLKIENIYDFISLDHLQPFWEVVKFSGTSAKTVASGILDLPHIKAGTSASVPLVGADSVTEDGEFWLNISFKSKVPTAWSVPGSEIAWSQFRLKEYHPSINYGYTVQNLRFKETATSVNVFTPIGEFLLDKQKGSIASWSHQANKILDSDGGPALTFWRAVTDNDRPWDAITWKRFGLDAMTKQVRNFSIARNGFEIRVEVQSYHTPPALAWGYDVETAYTFNDNCVIVHTKATPRGSFPPTIPRIGLEMKLPRLNASSITWLGLGPGQSYLDMKNSGKFGLWSQSLDEMNVQYEMPQEHGNRSGTRWVQVLNEAGSGVRATLQRNVESLFEDHGFDFAVHKHTARQLDDAKHPCDLTDNDFVVFRVDARHRGLGTGSCGPGVLDEYELRCEPANFTVKLEPVQG